MVLWHTNVFGLSPKGVRLSRPGLTRLSLAIATLVGTFFLTTNAIGSDPPLDLRPNLPVRDLAPSPPTQADRLAINNLIGADFATRFGITSESYDVARLIAETSIGRFYVIPGAHGLCLSLASGVACGDPGAPGSQIVAILAPASDGRNLVGGGVADASVDQVTITSGDDSKQFDVKKGVFLVPPNAGLRPSSAVTFAAS